MLCLKVCSNRHFERTEKSHAVSVMPVEEASAHENSSH